METKHKKWICMYSISIYIYCRQYVVKMAVVEIMCLNYKQQQDMYLLSP